MTKGEALKLALEFLENGSFVYPTRLATDLREALAQPEQLEQDPVVYDKTEMNSFVIDLYDEKMREGKHGHYEALFHCVHQAIKRAAHAVEGWVKIDEVREHFEAVNCGTIYKHGGEGRVPLYTAPSQRPWVGLTDEEIAQGNKESWVTEQAWQSAVWWAEAKLKEKNNG